MSVGAPAETRIAPQRAAEGRGDIGSWAALTSAFSARRGLETSRGTRNTSVSMQPHQDEMGA
jgi:hypothetical protein